MAEAIDTSSYYTAGNEHDVVLFRIGMRFNAFRGLRGLAETLGAFKRMPLMLSEQERDAAIGMLSSQTYLSWPNIEIVQFWRSYDELERYASARERAHAPAWSWWNKLGAKTGAVGIWHETYEIAAGTYESLYGCMPRHGLARATAHRPLGKGEARSRGRMGATRAARAATPAATCPVAHAT